MSSQYLQNSNLGLRLALESEAGRNQEVVKEILSRFDRFGGMSSATGSSMLGFVDLQRAAAALSFLETLSSLCLLIGLIAADQTVVENYQALVARLPFLPP